jgi:2-desacetyl-2-hydroxyethyl bacteriochlorophyllide A dehydrogenase
MRVTAIQQGKFVNENRDTPTPGSGQVLVRNLACGICGSDLHLFKMLSTMVDDNPFGDNLVLGHEYCSEIVEFGPDTERQLSPGQRVCSIPFLKNAEGQDPVGVSQAAPGAYSEYMLLSEEFLIPVPDDTSTEAAALVEPLAVAIHAVAKAKLSGQDLTLVMGCGPIGLAIIAVLKIQGVGQVIASDFSPKRRALASAMGADVVVDPASQSPFELLNDAVSDKGEDALIFECIGARGLLAQISEQAPAGARVVIAGVCTEDDTFNPFVAMQKELNIQFVFYYQPEEFAQALQILADNKISWRPFITGKVGLEGIAGAFESLQDPENHAKILIDPWQQGADIVPVVL